MYKRLVMEFKTDIVAFFIKLAAIIAIFFSPIIQVFSIIAIIVFCDFAIKMLGIIYQSGYSYLKEKFDKRRALDTGIKLIMYGIVLMAMYGVEQLLEINFELMKVLGAGIALNELNSINNNVKEHFGFSIYEILRQGLNREKIINNRTKTVIKKEIIVETKNDTDDEH